MERRRKLNWGLVVLMWTIPGLLQSVQEITYGRAQPGGGLPLSRVLLHFLPTWYPWILFTPLVMALARRFPVVRGSLVRAVGVHGLACLGFGLLHTLLLGLVRTHFPPGGGAPAPLVLWLRGTLWSLHSQVEVLAYGVLLAVTSVVDRTHELHERDVRAARLEGQLATVRAAARRARLQPHFLFNTLNAISVMMRDDVEAAESMLLKLSALLRVALEHEGDALLPLGQELEHLRLFLDIERVRFPDRLAVEFDVDGELADLPVPNMLLQPLVENAVRHGIAPLERGGRLGIRAHREGQWACFEVWDDGAGIGPRAERGIGLRTTEERLRELYGDRQTFRVEAREPAGTRVEIRIPALGPRSTTSRGAHTEARS